MNDGFKISAYAVNSILDRIDPLIREISGVLAGVDPECLHRMRVGSRRLRMALRLQAEYAGLPDSPAFSRLIRLVTRTLGEARDLDVQIMWLKEFLNSCTTNEKAGVSRLILRLSQERESIQPRIALTISDITDDPVFKKTTEALRLARLDAEMSGITTANSDVEHATRAINLQLDSVIQHSMSLMTPEAHEGHHRMRIEVKRLRYAMEISMGVYGVVEKELDGYMAVVKKLQAMLGVLHDADVWIGRIPEMSAAELERTKKYFGAPTNFSRLSPGYDAIARDRLRFREEQYERALNFWNETVDSGRWKEFRDLLLRTYREIVGMQG
ncbi:MAG: CHAD domain-containing protein [Synergistaceae bacterium]|jgi:CHAD domain-containing protein|nr:CHAD domain-containing protein [Synergistaceae bacterium]